MSAKTKPGLYLGSDGQIRRVEIDRGAGLKPYYALISTDIVERTHVEVFGRVAEVWCDEEGWFRSGARTNIVLATLSGGATIAGSVVLHGRSLDKIVARMREIGYAFEDEEEETNEH